MTLGPNQTAWLAALRSGDFQQGRRHLNHSHQFCCLGVACELFKTPETVIDAGHGVFIRYDDSSSTAPNFVLDALGLRGSLGQGRTLLSLATLNDRGTTFAQIADLIEANPQEYFRHVR